MDIKALGCALTISLFLLPSQSYAGRMCAPATRIVYVENPSLKAKLARCEEELTELRVELQEVVRQRNAATEKNRYLKRRLGHVQSQLNSCQNNVQWLTRLNEDLRSRLHEAEKDSLQQSGFLQVQLADARREVIGTTREMAAIKRNSLVSTAIPSPSPISINNPTTVTPAGGTVGGNNAVGGIASSPVAAPVGTASAGGNSSSAANGGARMSGTTSARGCCGSGTSSQGSDPGGNDPGGNDPEQPDIAKYDPLKEQLRQFIADHIAQGNEGNASVDRFEYSNGLIAFDITVKHCHKIGTYPCPNWDNPGKMCPLHAYCFDTTIRGEFDPSNPDTLRDLQLCTRLPPLLGSREVCLTAEQIAELIALL